MIQDISNQQTLKANSLSQNILLSEQQAEGYQLSGLVTESTTEPSQVQHNQQTNNKDNNQEGEQLNNEDNLFEHDHNDSKEKFINVQQKKEEQSFQQVQQNNHLSIELNFTNAVTFHLGRVSDEQLNETENQVIKSVILIENVDEKSQQEPSIKSISRGDLSPSKFKLEKQQKEQSQNNLLSVNMDQSRSMSAQSSKTSKLQSSNSSSNNSFSSSSSSSSHSFQSSINQIGELIESRFSINSQANNQNRDRQDSMKLSIERNLRENKTTKKSDLNINLDLSSGSRVLNQQKDRLSIFSSQSFQKKNSTQNQQKNSVAYSQHRDSHIQSLQTSINKICDLSPQSRRLNYIQKISKESLELSPKNKFSQEKLISLTRTSQLIDRASSKKNSISNSKTDLLYDHRRRAIKNTSEANEKFFSEMQKQSELFMNVYQLENPTFEHAAVQQFFKDIMKKVNKTPKEKILIKKIIEKLGVFENQKDIIFKNQNTNDTLFNNLSIEEFDKHQVIFHIGEFGYKYYIVVSGSVHLLLPQMDGKGGNPDNSAYVAYMNAIQSGYSLKNDENDQQGLQMQEQEDREKRITDVRQCSFFIRAFVKNQNQARFIKWVKEIGKDEKKITLMFGGLDHEKRQLINASFLEGKEFVNIFYPNMVLYKTFKPGECFGEIALLTKQRRTATMLCAEKTYCLTLSKYGFDQIIGAYQNSMIQAQLNFLQQFSFIEKIPKSKLLSIIHDMKKVEFQKGHVIYKEGDNTDYFYFIIEGEFEISKLEIIEQPQNIKDQYNNKCSLSQQESDCINKLNWTLKIKKEKNEMKRIPIVILQSNQYFGQNEIVRSQTKRQTRAICLSLTGSLYTIPKNILLYHLSNWNGLEELRLADQVINNWSYQRISQIIEIKKLRDNKFSELWKSPVKKRKKKQLKKLPSFKEDQNKYDQNDSIVSQNDNSISISKTRQHSLSPLKFQTNVRSFSIQMPSPKNLNFQKIDDKHKKNSLFMNRTLDQQNVFKFDFENEQQQIVEQSNLNFSQVADQEEQKSNEQPKKYKKNKLKLIKNAFQLFLPSLSLPSGKESNKIEGEQNFQSQILIKSNTQGSAEQIELEQKDEILSPSAFSKFKKQHGKKMNDKVLQLIEEQKQADRRKSELILNLIDNSSEALQRSNSKKSDSQKSKHSLDENAKSQTTLDKIQSSTKKRNPRQSAFFNSNSFGISQKSQRNSFKNFDEKLNNLNISHDIIQPPSIATSQKQLQPSISQIPITEKEIENQKQSELLVTNNLISTYKTQPALIQPQKRWSQQFQNGNNRLDQGKQNDQITKLDAQQQSQSQFQENIQDQSQQKINLPITRFFYHKNQQKKPFSSQKRSSKQISKSNSINGNFSQTQVSFSYSDKVIENDSKEEEKNHSSSRHDHCIKQNQQNVLSKSISCTNEITDLKELSKIRKAQLLEKVYINAFYNKQSEQSINSENKQLENLDEKAIQLKELMENSPRIAYKNMNNVMNFKKRFLKILSSTPAALQKKLFDFRSQQSDKYVYRKLRSNTKLALNKIFQANNYQPMDIHNEQKNNKSQSKDEISKEQKQSSSSQFLFSKSMSPDTLTEVKKHFNSISLSKDSSLNYQNKTASTLLPIHKIRNPMDQIQKIISQTVRQSKDSSLDSSLEKFRLDTSGPQMNQSNFDLKSMGNSFFQTPRKKFSFQNLKKPERQIQNSVSQAIKVIEDSNMSCFKSCDIPNDLSIYPEQGLVKKLNILSQRSQRSSNVIQKNFQNQFSHLITRINNNNSLEKSSDHIVIKQQNQKSTQNDTSSFEDINSLLASSNKKGFFKQKLEHKLQNINFSTNLKTGKIDNSDYIISQPFSQRKTVQQRIKEQQIKQKGIQQPPLYQPKSLLKLINQNSISKIQQDDFNKGIQKVQDQAINTKFSETSLTNIDFLSNLSPIKPEKIYLFQNVSPSRIIKKYS